MAVSKGRSGSGTRNFASLRTLAVDPGSTCMGLSYWEGGNLLDTVCIVATNDKAPFSVRLQDMLPKVRRFLADKPIDVVVCELVQNRLTALALGTVLLAPEIKLTLGKEEFIAASSWKKLAKEAGAQGEFKAIKGVRALRDMGFSPLPKFDDVADSILIALTYFSKVHKWDYSQNSTKVAVSPDLSRL